MERGRKGGGERKRERERQGGGGRRQREAAGMWIIRGEQEYTQEAGGVKAGGYRGLRGGDGAGFEQTFQRRMIFFCCCFFHGGERGN